MGNGFSIVYAFDFKYGHYYDFALLLMVGSFYAGTLFGNQGPIYVSNLNYVYSSFSSSMGMSFPSQLALIDSDLLHLLNFTVSICGLIL